MTLIEWSEYLGVPYGRLKGRVQRGMSTEQILATEPTKTRYNPAKGECVWTAVLTPEKVIEIRKRRESGEKVVDIAAEYGVSTGAISGITNGRTWKHV